VKLGKDAVYRQSGLSLAEAYELTSRVMVENLLEGDAADGISAFLEKREPNWHAK
jgi:enoyl-CoA hydratase/carnithine racemase